MTHIWCKPLPNLSQNLSFPVNVCSHMVLCFLSLFVFSATSAQPSKLSFKPWSTLFRRGSRCQEPSVRASSMADRAFVREALRRRVALEKLANIAWQTLLFVSESSAMDEKVTPDFRRKQQCLANNVGQLRQAFRPFLPHCQEDLWLKRLTHNL